MIISEKCNCCVHDKICSFKTEYLAFCEGISKYFYYPNPDCHDTFKKIKDSSIDVRIRCPHMMPQSTIRKGNINDTSRSTD